MVEILGIISLEIYTNISYIIISENKLPVYNKISCMKYTVDPVAG